MVTKIAYNINYILYLNNIIKSFHIYYSFTISIYFYFPHKSIYFSFLTSAFCLHTYNYQAKNLIEPIVFYFSGIYNLYTLSTLINVSLFLIPCHCFLFYLPSSISNHSLFIPTYSLQQLSLYYI